MPELTLDPHSSLPEADAVKVVAFGVGWDGHPYIATASAPLDYRTPDTGGAVFPKIRPDTPQSYRIYRAEPGATRLVATIEQEAFNIHQVQPVGRDQFLLVSARCQYRDEGADENGRLYRADGRLLRGITLGDGIQDVVATPDGLIWTSYFDEGVFGNFGWSDPLGSSGLVAWRQDGTPAYAYEPPDGLDRICDCYAMNADGTDLWICYDYDFPLVQIRNGRVEAHWQIPVHGADAFAISGNQALFRGGYGDQDCYHLLELAHPLAREKSRFQLRDRLGEPIKAQRAAGRGDTLFLLRGGEIFKLTIDDARRALGPRPQ